MNGGLQQQADGATELIPLRHRYIPNAKETPELAAAAKQEHVIVLARVCLCACVSCVAQVRSFDPIDVNAAACTLMHVDVCRSAL